MFHLALWFQAVAGHSAAEAGMRLLPGILGAVSGSLLGGVIMQKTGKYYWLTVITTPLTYFDRLSMASKLRPSALCSSSAPRSCPELHCTQLVLLARSRTLVPPQRE